MNRRIQRGFSLLELMIVLAIILVISVIAVPSYLRARQAAYEASAVGFTHSVQADQAAYRATHGSYATSFSQLPGYAADVAASQGSGAGNSGSGATSGGGLVGGGSITSGGGSGGGATSTIIRNSYVFSLVTLDDEDWYVTAIPTMDRTNGLYVYADSTGAMKTAKGASPSSDNLRAQ